METTRRHGSRRVSDSCTFLRSSLTCDEALVILDPFFEAVREVFIGSEMNLFGQSKMRRVRVECAPWVHDKARHFAGATEDGRSILVTPELAELPELTVVAILAHEFGHAMDFAYPALFGWSPDGLVHPLKRGGRRPTMTMNDPKRQAQAATAAMRQWRDRDADTVERVADAIAEEITGRRVGYSGPCRLQTLDAGMPRPAGLR